VGGANFDSDDSNTKQHWLLLTDEELTAFDAATGIETIQNSEFKTQNDGAPWYDLNGRMLNGKPNRKGVFIREGKKILY
jgi:hypothetical protein